MATYQGQFPCFDIVPWLFFFKIYFFMLERQSISRGKGREQGKRASQADSKVSVEPDTGLDPMTLRSQT